MLPHFQSGQPLKASDLETLVRHIRDTEITSVIGGRLSRVTGGQSIVIDPPTISSGGSTAVCPFQVTTANVGNDWNFSIEFGLIAGKIPTGMFAGGVPALIMTWTDGWILAAVTFVTDQVTVDAVSFEVHETIPENTETTAYYPVAYISTVSGENPTQQIQNLCATPIPSVCDLLFVPTSP